MGNSGGDSGVSEMKILCLGSMHSWEWRNGSGYTERRITWIWIRLPGPSPEIWDFPALARNTLSPLMNLEMKRRFPLWHSSSCLMSFILTLDWSGYHQVKRISSLNTVAVFLKTWPVSAAWHSIVRVLIIVLCAPSMLENKETCCELHSVSALLFCPNQGWDTYSGNFTLGVVTPMMQMGQKLQWAGLSMEQVRAREAGYLPRNPRPLSQILPSRNLFPVYLGGWILWQETPCPLHPMSALLVRVEEIV